MKETTKISVVDTTLRQSRGASPSERLLRAGAEALEDSELLGLLLGGSPGLEATELAQGLLSLHGGLAGLMHLAPEEIFGPGVGRARRIAVVALLELSRRLARARLQGGPLLDSPAAVVAYLCQRYDLLGQEVVGALYLDMRNRLLSERELFRGTLSSAAVEPRAVLRQGLRCRAVGAVLFHTHPSGDPRPSDEDFAFTRRLAEAGELVGIRLVDHLVVAGPGSWISLRRIAGAVAQPPEELLPS